MMDDLFGGVYRNRRVLVTGHTGFKGSWLLLWLDQLGATSLGYALAPNTEPSHHRLVDTACESVIADIRDAEQLGRTFDRFQPDVVFHMAAQPLVRLSYQMPRDTFETNVMGTVNVLEAARQTPSVRAFINITTDKCYENREWHWGYREIDRLGGYDPYSASKACSELATGAYRQSFFPVDRYGTDHQVLVATARAGNVVGGGDWAENRLIPDIVKATVEHQPVQIRYPMATRPWQHVLEPLSGYLQLGQKLINGETGFADAWNFGPGNDSVLTVADVLAQIQDHWPAVMYEMSASPEPLHEAGLLRLDCTKADRQLGWRGIWDGSKTFERTARWYRHYYDTGAITTGDDISQYVRDARDHQLAWALGA